MPGVRALLIVDHSTQTPVTCLTSLISPAVFGVAMLELLAFPVSQKIERRTDRAERPPLAVATQRLADRFDVRTVLGCEAENDRGVARIGVDLVAGLVVIQKQFGDAAIREATDRRREAQALELERVVFAHAPVRQALSFGRAQTST